VGTTATDLKNTATVTVSSTTATFSAAQPNNVGVGDAIVYGSTYIAFITGRTSSTVYTVQNATGGTPTAAGSGTSVAVYRSFTSLNYWSGNTTANTNIAAAVRDSVLMSNTDLVDADITLMVACYKDGVDTDNDGNNSAFIDSIWVTGPSNYIKIYTPFSLSEVGASQRHTGVAGTGYVLRPSMSISNGSFMEVHSDYVRIEGIEFDGSDITLDGEFYGVTGWSATPTATDFRVDSILMHDVTLSGTSTYGFIRGIYFGSIQGSATNNIIYNLIVTNSEVDMGVNAIYEYEAGVTCYWYNNTIYHLDANNGVAAGIQEGLGTIHAKNNYVGDLAGNWNAYAFYWGTTDFAAGSTNNASSDDTADDGNLANGKIDQTSYSSYFVSTTSGLEDFHLKPSDTALRNAGTSLTSDAGYPFAADIDGDPRPIGGVWDIGADEAQNSGFVGMEF
jgi:hypothetical protein